MSQITRTSAGSGAASIETLTGNSGGVVGPDGSFNINIVGAGSITVAGNPSTNTLTVELQNITQYDVLIGGASNTIVSVSPSTSGYVLTSNGTSANPSFKPLSGSGAVISLTTQDSNVVTPNSSGTIFLDGAHGLNTTGAVAYNATVAINNAITLGDLSALGTSNALTATTGNIQIVEGNLILVPTYVSTNPYGAIGFLNVSTFVPLFHGYSGWANTFVGDSSGNFTLTTGTSVRNTAVGKFTLIDITTGTDNTVMGSSAGAVITQGAGNTIIGSSSGTSITTGDDNTIVGYMSGTAITTGSNNVVIGYDIVLDSSASNAIAIGGLVSGGMNDTICIGNINTSLQTAFYACGIVAATAGPNSQLPIVIDSSTYKVVAANFLSVSQGGTGETSFTAYAPICGGTTTTAHLQSASTGLSTSGYVLTSTGSSSLPTFQAPAASSISITGDSGGALTGAAFTFTGGTTGLTFAGATTTETLGGTLSLANGGTSADLTASNGGIFYSTASAGAILAGTATARQMLQSGSSTTPAWSTATWPATTTINQLLYSSANNVVGGVTAADYGVLISSSSGVPEWLANGTTGQVLTATTSGTPSWAAASGGISTLDADSGSATGSTVTISGGTTGLTTTASSATMDLTGTLIVGNGGTGVATMTTAYAPVCAGTSATGALQVASTGLSTSGYVLTSTGASSLPSFQAPASSSITITGDTGGGLTGTSFTFSGGTTGLSFGGSGTTETLTFAGITANGGTVSLATDATGSTINIGTGAGAKLVTLGSTNGASALTLQSGSGNIAANTGLTVDSTGRMYNTKQPTFSVYLGTNDTNATGNSTVFTLGTTNALTKVFDVGTNFNTNGTFTAPVTGKYSFSMSVLLLNNTTTAELLLGFSATARTLNMRNNRTASNNNFGCGASCLMDMTAGDTCTFTVTGTGNGADTCTIQGASNNTWITGVLIC